MIRLVIHHEGKVVSDFVQEKTDKEITIGRAPGCAVRLDDSVVSRLHAVIRFVNGSWVLERKASFGAVSVNGQEIENAPLQGGEEIRIGKFSLQVEIGDRKDKTLASISMASVSEPYQEDVEGRTRITGSPSVGLFRFDPGTASITEYAMEKDVAVFGRGSNCDVILLEKKASRKHIEIRKRGLSFFLKDLNSANGTKVNGKTVSEAELVPGDEIQIGEGKIQFSIENREFFSKQDQFLAVPSHLQESEEYSAPAAGALPTYGANQEEGLAIPESAPIPGIGGGPEEKSLVKKLVGKFRSLPKTQRILILLLLLAGVPILFNQEEEKPVKKVAVKAPPGSERKFEYLSPQKKKAVAGLYDELFKDIQGKEYQKAVDAAQKILDITEDYKDTKQYQKRAETELKRIAEQEEERQRQEAQEALRKQIEALEAQGKILYEQALKDPAKRPELDQKIQEIFSKDPNDNLAAQWQTGISEQVDKEKKEEERKAAREELRKKAETAYDAVVITYKNGDYIKALADAENLQKIGYDEKAYTDKIQTLKDDIRSKLHSIVDPLLKEASAQNKEGGDLVKAKELYMQVLKVDGANPEATKGLNSIREVLHFRARRFYAEAILAESVSDLADAKEKYAKCEKTAPDDDAYRVRCHNKLSRYDLFAPGGEQ